MTKSDLETKIEEILIGRMEDYCIADAEGLNGVTPITQIAIKQLKSLFRSEVKKLVGKEKKKQTLMKVKTIIQPWQKDPEPFFYNQAIFDILDRNEKR